LVEIGKALHESKDKIDYQKLFEYLSRNENEATKKRFLFLVDLLGLTWTTHYDEMLKEIGPSFPLLDTTGPNQGRKNSRFGLKINIDVSTIKNSIFT